MRAQSGGPFYQEGSPLGPREGAMYDDPPRSRGRNGLITAATLVACAVVGTVAAYGYRTYAGGGTPKNPPVIMAETTPSKVPPALDSQSNKAIQDRVRDQGQGERLVNREEPPIDIRGSAPRQVLPSPFVPSPSFGNPPLPGGGNQPSGAARGGQQPPSNAGGVTEPKSVRTIPIRPDGTDLSGRPVTGSTATTGTVRPTTAPKNAQAGRGGPVCWIRKLPIVRRTAQLRVTASSIRPHQMCRISRGWLLCRPTWRPPAVKAGRSWCNCRRIRAKGKRSLRTAPCRPNIRTSWAAARLQFGVPTSATRVSIIARWSAHLARPRMHHVSAAI